MGCGQSSTSVQTASPASEVSKQTQADTFHRTQQARENKIGESDQVPGAKPGNPTNQENDGSRAMAIVPIVTTTNDSDGVKETDKEKKPTFPVFTEEDLENNHEVFSKGNRVYSKALVKELVSDFMSSDGRHIA